MACTIPTPTVTEVALVPLTVSPRSLAAAFTRGPDPRRAGPIAGAVLAVVVAWLPRGDTSTEAMDAAQGHG